ncbi:hypothetical protein Tco_0520732 [Tanacetum coccineum]
MFQVLLCDIVGIAAETVCFVRFESLEIQILVQRLTQRTQVQMLMGKRMFVMVNGIGRLMKEIGEVLHWETAMYGKIWYNEDVHDLRYVETEFPAIVLNDTLMSEPTVSSPNNNEIDFRISFDESDNEDYTVLRHMVPYDVSLGNAFWAFRLPV